MKTLTLLRHAKSGWDAPALRDFDRPLSPRGHKAARAMGRELRRLGLGYDLILASPALRVIETLHELAQGYGAAVATETDERIYLASAETLLELVRAADDGTDGLMLAGHNPGLEQLAVLLARESEARSAIAVKYPTGALAEIALDATRWQDISEGAGTLTRFLRPRDLER